MAERKGGSQRGGRAAKSAGEHQFSEDIGTAIIDGLTFASKAVQYAAVDGMALVEGDINLGPVETVQEKTEIRRQEMSGAPIASGVLISGSQFRWPNCVIPYQIQSGLTNQARVTDAVAHWEARTNYRFVLRTAANSAQYNDYVEFVSGSGCSSFVGRQGGRQTVTLAAGCSTGNCIHEIGHVVGLWHEQSREDRDNFVTIQWANIIPSAIHNFAQHINDGDDVGPYDYASIMHYPRNAFTANGQDTIIPTDPNAQIGQRTQLSAGDTAAANSLCPLVPLTRTFTFPTRTRPTLTFPTRTRPTLTFPTRTRPTLTFPTRTSPTFTFPTRTFPTRTFPPPTGPRGTFLPGRTFLPPIGPRFDPYATGYEGYYDPYGYGGYDPYAAGYEGYYDPYGTGGYDPYATGYEGYEDPYGTGGYDPYGTGGHEGSEDPYGYGG